MVENNCKNPLCIDGKIYIPLKNGKISEDNFDECPDCGPVPEDYHEVLRNLNRGRITVSEAHDIYKKEISDYQELRELQTKNFGDLLKKYDTLNSLLNMAMDGFREIKEGKYYYPVARDIAKSVFKKIKEARK